MKRITTLLVAMLVLTGCGTEGLTSLKVPYEVQSLVEYNEKVNVSQVTRNKSDFQLLELGIEDVFYYNLYDYVITMGEPQSGIETLNAQSLSYIEISEEDYAAIFKAITESQSIKLTPSGKIIPALPELTAQAAEVPLSAVFVKSILRELGV